MSFQTVTSDLPLQTATSEMQFQTATSDLKYGPEDYPKTASDIRYN